MLVIGNTVVSEQIFTAHFACDLMRCKGICCVEGAAGAPLEEEERASIEACFPAIRPYLSKEALDTIAREGLYRRDAEYGLVTTTVGSGHCVYAIEDPQTRVVSCAFQKHHAAHGGHFPKPISCHLYPIRVRKTKINELLNYEKIPSCACAWARGRKERMPLFRFLRSALVRKYGAAFFEALEVTYRQFFKNA